MSLQLRNCNSKNRSQHLPVDHSIQNSVFSLKPKVVQDEFLVHVPWPIQSAWSGSGRLGRVGSVPVGLGGVGVGRVGLDGVGLGRASSSGQLDRSLGQPTTRIRGLGTAASGLEARGCGPWNAWSPWKPRNPWNPSKGSMESIQGIQESLKSKGCMESMDSPPVCLS